MDLTIAHNVRHCNECHDDFNILFVCLSVCLFLCCVVLFVYSILIVFVSCCAVYRCVNLFDIFPRVIELSIGFLCECSQRDYSIHFDQGRSLYHGIHRLFGGYLSVQVCSCTLQKIRQNLPEFLQMCCSYYLRQTDTQGHTEYHKDRHQL